MQKKKQKVYVAMSGGVDSSVSAALLKRDGFGVVGVYMKCWTANDPLYKGCTSVDDERMARLAAAHLKIPFYAWNFIKEYKKRVVEYMLEGYKKGITPNPDVMCNREIKFGLFFDKAIKLGAEYVATGHYTKVQDGKFFQAKDKNKDQSYFLSFIKPQVLSKVLFPVGNYTKPEVRAIAKKLGLPNAERKESQGVCFIGKLDFEDFLKQHIKSSPGDIVDVSGKMLGKHEGLVLYTIGQRKGIGLSGGPYYVVRKDFKRNKLFVSKNEKNLFSKRALVSNVNWLVDEPTLRQAQGKEKKEQSMEVKIRYRTPSAPAKIVRKNKNTYELVFQRGQRAITPGQFAAFYKGEKLLGGGVIS